jgi:hypothetical protein
VDFDFPMNVTLPANGFALVVNFDPATNQAQLAEFKAAFPDLWTQFPCSDRTKANSPMAAALEVQNPIRRKVAASRRLSLRSLYSHGPRELQ